MSKEVGVDDLARGWIREPESGMLACLYCDARFSGEEAYHDGDKFLLAPAAARRHVGSVHGGPFEALSRDGVSGLTDVQVSVLALSYAGKSDADIAAALGGKSASTIRNHRFNIRKRAAEAKVLLALTRLLDERAGAAGDFVAFHAAMPVSDDRVVVGEGEAARIEAKYMTDVAGGGLALKAFPKKQKEKLVVLKRLAALFDRGSTYTEPEVNRIFSPVWDDYVTLRRYLIEYRFMDRKPGGSAYWRT